MTHTGSSPRSRHARNKLEAVEDFLRFARGQTLPTHPLDVFLEVSNVCDLRCAMCARFSALNPDRLSLIRSEARGFMEVDELARSLEGILPRALTVYVFGYGEPTIHPELRRLLAFLSEHEVLVEFFTNGMHFEPDLVEDLVTHRVHRITLSFSGSSREDYESVYLGGDYDRVLAGLARLRDRKRAAGTAYPILEVNSLAFRHHVGSLDRFVEIMAEHGVDQVNVTPLHEHAQSIGPLVGHAAPPASLADDRVAARAREHATRLGLRLNIHPALTHPPGVLRQPSRSATEAVPPTPGRPRVPIRDFPSLAKRLEVRPAPSEGPTPLPTVDPERDTVDQVRLGLRPQRIRDLADHGSDFICLEPFKSIYIRRNGQVKVCCFMQEDVPALGSIRSHAALPIWQGSGFRAVRHSILNSEYPIAACGYCLLNQQAPDSHGLDTRAVEYARWHVERFGPSPEVDRLREVARELGTLGEGKDIVGRMVEASSTLLLEKDTLERGRRLLGLLAGLSRPLGPYRQLVEGYLDLPGPDTLTGWVWSPMFPELRLEVACRVDGRQVATTVAQGLRADVRAAGKGDGRYGFGFCLDRTRLGDGEVEVRVFLGDTACELDGSPRTMPPQASP